MFTPGLTEKFNPVWLYCCVNTMTHFFCPCLPTVQFDGAEWDRSSSPTERLRPPGPRSSPLAGGGMKFRTPLESPTMMGERVDATLPLEMQVYVFMETQHLIIDCTLICWNKPIVLSVAFFRLKMFNWIKLIVSLQLFMHANVIIVGSKCFWIAYTCTVITSL